MNWCLFIIWCNVSNKIDGPSSIHDSLMIPGQGLTMPQLMKHPNSPSMPRTQVPAPAWPGSAGVWQQTRGTGLVVSNQGTTLTSWASALRNQLGKWWFQTFPIFNPWGWLSNWMSWGETNHQPVVISGHSSRQSALIMEKTSQDVSVRKPGSNEVFCWK